MYRARATTFRRRAGGGAVPAIMAEQFARLNGTRHHEGLAEERFYLMISCLLFKALRCLFGIVWKSQKLSPYGSGPSRPKPSRRRLGLLRFALRLRLGGGALRAQSGHGAQRGERLRHLYTVV